ncbi:peptidoglycan DD-metalloendopeptidase family protein [Microcoleus sp. FACHB-831]|nr:peptidoglycan DD-metalloendopeptidase family protein [Microcoleus sp. FACHB-831]
MQGLGWIGGLGILSSGIVWAQSDSNPDKASSEATGETSVPDVVRSLAPPAPKREASSRRRRLVSQAESENRVVREDSVSPPLDSSVSTRAKDLIDPPRRSRRSLDKPPLPYESAKVDKFNNNAYIDSTEYSIGATRTYDEPNSVIASEGSTRCRKGCGNRTRSIATADTRRSFKTARVRRRNLDTANARRYIETRRVRKPNFETAKAGRYIETRGVRKPNFETAKAGRYIETRGVRKRNLETANVGRYIETSPLRRRELASADIGRYIESTRKGRSLRSLRRSRLRMGQTAIAAIGPVKIGPLRVNISGIRMKNSIVPTFDDGEGNEESTTPTPLAYYNPKIYESGRAGNGNTSMLFPLSIPASITSVFGWRIHPISGDRRFHAGTDIGAPVGTPVLAAYAGKVAIADWMGGYGLSVVLQHNETRESLYAHLSEIAVQPGQWVEQGSVIGKVGNTGSSTGSHLHFEWRELTEQGWVAHDPGSQLDSAHAELMKALETAQVNPQPGIPSFTPSSPLPKLPTPYQPKSPSADNSAAAPTLVNPQPGIPSFTPSSPLPKLPTPYQPKSLSADNSVAAPKLPTPYQPESLSRDNSVAEPTLPLPNLEPSQTSSSGKLAAATILPLPIPGQSKTAPAIKQATLPTTTLPAAVQPQTAPAIKQATLPTTTLPAAVQPQTAPAINSVIMPPLLFPTSSGTKTPLLDGSASLTMLRLDSPSVQSKTPLLRGSASLTTPVLPTPALQSKTPLLRGSASLTTPAFSNLANPR